MLAKLKTPLNNKEGSVLDLFKYSALGMISVVMIVWLLIMLIHIRVESYVQSSVYNLGDAISESTVVTSSIQKEFKRRFDSYKWYTGDYEIIYYKTDYSTGVPVRTKLATSANGDTVPDVRYTKGDIVEVVYKTKGKVLLDKVNLQESNAGLAVSFGGKIF